jgi:putative ABC transport system substrate-binding protein
MHKAVFSSDDVAEFSHSTLGAPMRRRDFIKLIGGAAASSLSCLRVGRAQPAAKAYRVGILETNSPLTNAANFDALRKGMIELGYIEGQTLFFEYRSADGRNERFPELAADLVRLKVDLIVTRSTPAVLAVKAATTTIPVVMAATANPVGDRIVASLARPGGNITGLTSFHSELSTKRLQILREMIPRIALVATLSDPSNPVTPGQEDDVRKAAQSLGIATRFLGARNREELEPAFGAAAREKVEALIVRNSAPTQANLHLTIDLADKHRLPAIYASREFVDAGGLVTYGVSYPALYRRAAAYVDRILKGVKPADLPIEQPTKFELVLNLKTARALGLTVPNMLLVDEVIE